ncbi:MAG: hypothetical protein WCG42_09825 [Parachlamydiaceae bacterium]
MSIRVLENKPSSVLWEIASGKPDLNQPSPEPGQKDTRKRVFRGSQEANTCAWRVEDWLRQEVGSIASGASEELRRRHDFERKVKWAFNVVVVTQNALFAEFMKDFSASIDSDIGDIEEKVSGRFSGKSLPELVQATTYDSQTFKSAKIAFELLGGDHATEVDAMLGKQIEQWYNEWFQKCHDGKNGEELKDGWRAYYEADILRSQIEQLDPTLLSTDPRPRWTAFHQEQWPTVPSEHTYNTLLSNMRKEGFGLKKSSWHPSQKIEELIQELKKHGPLAMGGKFGTTFYEPKDLRKSERSLAGRSLWYWKPGSSKSDHGLNHAVLVIGAEKITEEDKQRVFFIDPNDASSPEDWVDEPMHFHFNGLSMDDEVKHKIPGRELQRIFIISFENFLNSLHAERGGSYQSTKDDLSTIQTRVWAHYGTQISLKHSLTPVKEDE